MNDPTRRRFVRTTALASIGVIAGCGGTDDEDGGGAEAPNETDDEADGEGAGGDEAGGGEAETTEAMAFGDPRARSE